MKTVWKIVGRVVVGLLLTAYVAIALLNYSVVQSYLGTAAGRYLSREWGGTVKIGALHAMPWDHLILNNVLLVAPDNDTIFSAKRLRVHFKQFPYKEKHLTLDRIYLRQGYYHLAVTEDTVTGEPHTNLDYILEYYHLDKHRELLDTFTVDVGTLTLDHVRYKMDLPEIPTMNFDVGVSIAHMEFVDIVSRVKDIHVVNDDVTCRLVKMTAEERSGFKATQIEGNVHVGRNDITVTDFELRTPQTTVAAEVEMRYHDWMGEDYCDSVYHDITLKEGTSVALSDAAYWAPWLWGCETQIDATGNTKGTINDMRTELALHWGGRSGLLVAGNLYDIARPDTARVDIDIERLWTNLDDLAPLFTLMHVAPQQLALARQIDYIDFAGRLRGGLHTLTTANINIASGLGNLHADALLSPTPSGGMRFNAEVGSNGMGLKMLQSDWLSHTGFTMSAKGYVGDMNDISPLYANLEGQLLNSVVRGQRLAPIDVACKLEGGTGSLNIESTDSLALLALRGDFDLADSVKSAHGILNVERLDLMALQLMPEKYGLLKTHAELQYEGKDLETMQGGLALKGTQLGDLQVERLTLNADARDGYKELRLRSDPMELMVDGHFDYEDLALIARQAGHEALPADLFDIAPLTEEELGELEQSNVYLHMLWKDDGRFLETVDDGVMVAKNTRLTGSYNSAERLKMVLRSDSLRLGSAVLNDVGLDGRREIDGYVVRLLSQEVNIGTVELLQRADLQLKSDSARTLLELAWGYIDAPSQGDLELQLKEGFVNVLKPDFSIGATPWKLLIDTLHIAHDKGMCLTGNGISVRSETQSVDARLCLLRKPNDMVELTFNRFDLAGLMDIVLQESPVTMSGDIDGRFSMYGLNEIPYFNANLQIDSCVVNRQPLGDVMLRSNWNAELNILNLQLDGDQLGADGWLVLGSSDGEINFSVDFDRFDLALAAPLLSSFSSRFEGLLHGTFDITGTLSHPLIVGEALVEDGALQLDMTGVTYFFNDSLQFTNKRIILDGFRLRDPRNNTAYVDGTINYDDLSDVQLDLSLRTDNLLVLDRRQGDEFYGTALAAAQGTVRGPVDALKVNVNARTMPGCTLTVPVNDQRQVKAQDYIHFVSDRPMPTSRQTAPHKEQKISVEVDLAITPDVQLNLPMDFSELGAKVSANGAGDLHLTMSGSETPQVLGNYEISSGTMKFSAISLISKEFTIENGSSLNFQGSLPDARFDLQAVYSQRVNLSTLTGGTDMGGSQKYIQVENVIAIAGTLQEPTIGFDIRLPNADASVEEEVFAYIDRNSERDMLNQTLSLLAVGHFYNSNGGAMANGNIATSGSISALNSILSDMTGVDIGVDYKMGNELTTNQLDVNISKDWGRFYLESTLGYGGESRELQTSDVNSAIIDALVGYRLNPLVHLYAYNRTNTNDYTRMDLPYKQGVGLKLTKDFDNWGELFKSQNKKQKP